MLKIKEGDLDKVGLLYQRYSRRLFGFFYRMTNDGSQSEDLVQNVFIRLIKYRKTYWEDGHFETWIFQLARNVHHDAYRKTKRYKWQEDMTDWEAKLTEEDNVESSTIKGEEQSLLIRALNTLSPEKREIIELTKFQKLKYEEVANLLGKTEGALKVQIHRILKELRLKYFELEAE